MAEQQLAQPPPDPPVESVADLNAKLNKNQSRLRSLRSANTILTNENTGLATQYGLARGHVFKLTAERDWLMAKMSDLRAALKNKGQEEFFEGASALFGDVTAVLEGNPKHSWIQARSLQHEVTPSHMLPPVTSCPWVSPSGHKCLGHSDQVASTGSMYCAAHLPFEASLWSVWSYCAYHDETTDSTEPPGWHYAPAPNSGEARIAGRCGAVVPTAGESCYCVHHRGAGPEMGFVAPPSFAAPPLIEIPEELAAAQAARIEAVQNSSVQPPEANVGMEGMNLVAKAAAGLSAPPVTGAPPQVGPDAGGNNNGNGNNLQTLTAMGGITILGVKRSHDGSGHPEEQAKKARS